MPPWSQLRLEGTPVPSASTPVLRLESTPLPSAPKKPELRLESTPSAPKATLRLEGTPLPSAPKPAPQLESTPSAPKATLRLEGTPLPSTPKPTLRLIGTPVHSTPPSLSKKRILPSTVKPLSNLDSLTIKPAKNKKRPHLPPGNSPKDGNNEWTSFPDSKSRESDNKWKDGDNQWGPSPESATQDSSGWWRPFPAPTQSSGDGLKPFGQQDSGAVRCGTQISYCPLGVSSGETILFYIVVILFALKMICWAIEFAFFVWSWTVRWTPKLRKLRKVPQTKNGSNKERSPAARGKKTGGTAPH